MKFKVFGVGEFSSRGQAVIESIIILATGVFLLTALVAIVYDQITGNYAAQQQKQGYAAISTLVGEINDAYYLGPGTVKNIVVTIPSSADLNNSYIRGSTLVLKVNGSDLSRNSDVNVVGKWPNTDGSNAFVITAFGDYVSLSTQAISFSPAQIAASIDQNSSEAISIIVSNISPSDLNYSVSADINGLASVSYSGSNPFSIYEGQSAAINFTVSCAKTAVGEYSGRVILAPANAGDINLGIPVRVECASAQTKLSIFPSTKNISVAASSTSSDSALVCNNSAATLPSVVSSISGEAAKYVFTSFSGDLNQSSCRTMPLLVKAPAAAGNYGGEISVTAGGFTTSSGLSLTVN